MIIRWIFIIKLYQGNICSSVSRLRNAESSSGYSSGAGLSSSPSAASSYLSVPSASRFSSGTNSPLFLSDRNRTTTDTSANNKNEPSLYSTLSPSGTVSPNANSASRYETTTTVPNYNRYRLACMSKNILYFAIKCNLKQKLLILSWVYLS